MSALVASQLGSVSPADGAVTVADAQAAYNHVFVVSVCMALACAVLATRLPGRAGAPAHRRARLTE